MPTRRRVFFVSDRTGLTVEALGSSLLTQFGEFDFLRVTLPFIDSIPKAIQVVAQVNEAHRDSAERPLVFALANPTPEIMPEDAAPYVAVMATGRSDYPNQINNVLCFPGIFRGALACRARRINEEMKLAAANAIAGIITDAELHPEYVVPSVFDKRVAEAVAREVEVAAYQTGVARSKVDEKNH